MDISEIPSIPDREKRFEEILVDCYGQYEELASINVYLEEALLCPFTAFWKDLDEPGHREKVTVIAVDDMDDRRGILLRVRRSNGKERKVVAEQVWAVDTEGQNAIVLDDYRYWVNQMNDVVGESICDAYIRRIFSPRPEGEGQGVRVNNRFANNIMNGLTPGFG